MICSICGGSQFVHRDVLWPKLVNEWQLSPQEVQYVNAQQGTACGNCGANLRSIALADSICAHLNVSKSLLTASDQVADSFSILEINEAGSLSPILRRFKGYEFGAYPHVDMHDLPYADDKFDVVVHSDTLEHVRDPIHALAECRRVLRQGGALCFTVPVVVGRLTRSREGLPISLHGNTLDYTVWTEFGADVWACVMAAGFSNVCFYSFEYPSGIAILAKK